MHRFDPVSALFFGVSSLWVRLVLFFVAICAGHTLGMVFADTTKESSLLEGYEWELLWAVPVSVLWQAVQNALFLPGLLYLALLLTGFIGLIFREWPPLPTVVALALVQMWDSLLIQRYFGTQTRNVSMLLSPPPEFTPLGYYLAGGLTLLPFLLVGLAYAWNHHAQNSEDSEQAAES